MIHAALGEIANTPSRGLSVTGDVATAHHNRHPRLVAKLLTTPHFVFYKLFAARYYT